MTRAEELNLIDEAIAQGKLHHIPYSSSAPPPPTLMQRHFKSGNRNLNFRHGSARYREANYKKEGLA